jgi:hypothetical protein
MVSRFLGPCCCHRQVDPTVYRQVPVHERRLSRMGICLTAGPGKYESVTAHVQKARRTDRGTVVIHASDDPRVGRNIVLARSVTRTARLIGPL